MGDHSLRHAVNVAADHAKVRDALTSVEGLKGWTMADVSGGGGVGSKWTLKYPGGPTFVWESSRSTITRSHGSASRGRAIRSAPPSTFELGKTPHGRVHLTFSHAGWPHQEGNFDKCNACGA